jgi:hypothetical protein
MAHWSFFSISQIMKNLYLGSAYWAPISYYTALYRHGGAVIEQYDAYIKQTYRNRCAIIGAQGVQMLTVPVEKPLPSMVMRDVRISDHGNWRHLHRSAIASAYQVVSATATQLNAGTAYLTSVNETPISASRAGNAANASLANSAWYDGTGRLISALPDSAAVSSIASSYAESAASGKLDSSSQVVTSTGSASAMMMGGTTYYASQINGLYISAQKAYVADEWMHAGNKLDATASAKFYTTANESGYVDSAYVESQVSGKQDALTFDWDADSAISSINGSALAGQGGGGVSITAVSYDTATQQSSVVTATGFGIVDSATNYPRVSSVHLTDGQTRYIEANTLAPGAAQTASGSILYTLLFSPRSSMWTTADAATGIFSPLQYGTGAGLFMDSNNFKGYIKGNELFISNTAIGRAARLEVHQSRGSRLGLTGQNGSETVNLKESELAIVNSAVSTATLGRTKLVFQSPVSGTGTYSTNYINLYDTAESATKTISSTSIDYWNGKADSSALSSYLPYSSLEYNTTSAISGINGSALAAGSTYSAGEGIDITDDVISVETPVDIVAGPGIVIDNPDGNTLRVSTDENYETVLWSGEALTGITLSESLTNFEQIKVVYAEGAGSTRIGYFVTNHFDATHLAGVGSGFYWEDTSEYPMHIHGINLSISNNAVTVVTALAQCFSITNNAFIKWDMGSSFRLLKIMGIHRIANN